MTCAGFFASPVSAGAVSDVADVGEGAPTFRQQVQPILAKYGCSSGACHGAAAGKNGFKLSLRGWDAAFDYDVLTRDASGRRIVRAEPERSLMLLKPTASMKHGGGERFKTDSVEYRLLRDWIAAGCPGPTAADPVVARVEVEPAAVTLKNGDTQPVKVLAHYTDGEVRDVTRWAKFSTTNDGVATVDEAGLAKIVGPGEAAINAWYDSRIATAHLSAPFPNTIDPAIFERSPRFNFIDEHVLAKLKALNLPPAAQADDGTFIRRAYLDAAGILPTPEDVALFIADGSADKRETLIDELLGREEFNDYWAYRISDVLLVSTEKLKARPAMLAFYRFIRESVAANVPWDRFVREIVTARGSNLENGAVNFFMIHKETTDATETVSQAFLGLSIQCAKCHNHPFEKWTLNDYYGMANLMSRVKLKDGDRTGEVILQSTASGDINNLATGQPSPPRPLDGEPMAVDSMESRRERLAAWLTAAENPYFARAIVNRVWANFMGRGLADPEDDLRDTNPVSNEPLMRALAEDFVAQRFDLRHLIKTIMTSAAYQRSSDPAPGGEADDRYGSHYTVRRLPAEILLDAYATVTGVPTDFPGYPKGWRAMQLPDSEVASYFLDTFGRPERVTTCSCERTESASITQALHVSNGDTLNQKLRAAGGTIDRLLDANAGDARVLERIYMLALGRVPSESESAAAMKVLASTEAADADARQARRERIEDVTWAVLTSKEFMFNH